MRSTTSLRSTGLQEKSEISSKQEMQKVEEVATICMDAEVVERESCGQRRRRLWGSGLGKLTVGEIEKGYFLRTSRL